jgi:hypothetical protein
VINSICGLLTAEGMTSEIRAVNVTQPLIGPATLKALSEAAFYGGHSTGAAENAGNVQIPVEMPTKSCIARSIDALDPSRDRDVMVLQFSAPLANPFQRGEPGVVVRLSLGDESPTWYWVSLSNRTGKWTAGLPSSLAVRQ